MYIAWIFDDICILITYIYIINHEEKRAYITWRTTYICPKLYVSNNGFLNQWLLSVTTIKSIASGFLIYLVRSVFPSKMQETACSGSRQRVLQLLDEENLPVTAQLTEHDKSCQGRVHCYTLVLVITAISIYKITPWLLDLEFLYYIYMFLRKFQQTPGTYPSPSTTCLWRTSFYVCILGYLGSVPGVC